MIQIDVGDILTLKKPHPCGSYEWEVLRIGQDLRLKMCRMRTSDDDCKKEYRKKILKQKEKM